MKTASRLVPFVALGLLGCAVGPDFHTPAAPAVKGYTNGQLPAQTSSTSAPDGASQRFVLSGDVPAQWWKLFGSPQLDALVDQAFKANPDVQAAEASLVQAQETVKAGYGALLPDVDMSLGASREKYSGAQFGQPGTTIPAFNLYNASVNVSYGLDIFGGSRREIESLEAQADMQRYELKASYLTLSANVVTTAITEASLKEQIKQTHSIIALEQELLNITQRQLALGAIARTAVLEQQTTLAQTQATLPPLEKQLAQQQHRLAILAGNLPGDQAAVEFDLDALHLPQDVPVSLPSRLTEQRPDIKAAEATLHAASAQVGVATANMLPQITLTGGYGAEATVLHSLFSPGTTIWNLGAGLTQPIFHGGELLHEKRAAVAAYDKALAQYKSTVLLAFANVADTLRALQFDADLLAAQANAEGSAQAAMDMARVQFAAGAISHTQLLNAESALAQARISLVQARATRLADTAALFQALGGGWWNTPTANTNTQTQNMAQAEKRP